MADVIVERVPAVASSDRVTVVVVAYNSGHILSETLAGLAGRVPVIVADNGSVDDTLSVVRTLGRTIGIVALGRNLGFGRANNAALDRVETPYALLLNPDCLISVEAIEALLTAAERYPEAAILAPRLYDAPGRLGMCYRPAFHRPQPRELVDPEGDLCSEFLTGAAMLLRMEVFHRIGGFDPWFFLYLEDDDLCLRARAAGHSLILVHDARVGHRVKQSSSPSLRLDYRRAYCQAASKLYMINKHLGGAAFRRAHWRMLGGAPLALLGGVLTFNAFRTIRALGRAIAALRAPWLLHRDHCIDYAS